MTKAEFRTKWILDPSKEMIVEEEINKSYDRYKLKSLNTPAIFVSEYCECNGVQDLHAMTGDCRKCGKQCTY